ncbi:sensitivity to red-light reduced protein [Haplosporangium sp. Z 767]|nr:sensitivity to red-light reduced protein [Haplosporangium sp. Z 11]KAF9180173.1 sensitivity to red-light reduced protein [Haplosporangium sp. Z 767]
MCPKSNNGLSSPTLSFSLSPTSPLQSKQQEHSPPLSPTIVPSSSSSPILSLTLPMSSITPPGSPPSPTLSVDSIRGRHESGLQQRKLRVMIVDDNPINLDILSRMLQRQFADLVELAAVMTSGVEALEKLGSEEVDLILMDIDMPVLNGVETTKAIRQNTPEHPILEKNQSVPIIAVTTSDGEEQRELYQQVGMSDCVSKPIAIANLRSAIECAIKD